MLEKKRVFSWKTYVPYAESLRIVILRYLEKFLGFLVFLGQGNSEKTKENKKVEKAKKCYTLFWTHNAGFTFKASGNF